MEWIVDGNNVLGARPDGWWRDRRGAARRLVGDLGRFGRRRGERVIVIFDGRLDEETVEAGLAAGVTVGFAPGGPNAADDAIARLVGRRGDTAEMSVVTSDRELAARVAACGAAVVGARTFRDRLAQAGRSQPDGSPGGGA